MAGRRPSIYPSTSLGVIRRFSHPSR